MKGHREGVQVADKRKALSTRAPIRPVLPPLTNAPEPERHPAGDATRTQPLGAEAPTEDSDDLAATSWPQEFHGRKLWRLRDGIDTIAAGAGVDADALMRHAKKGITDKTLMARDSARIRVAGDNVSELLDWFFAEDFNRWLDAIEAPFAFRLTDPRAELAPEGDCEPLSQITGETTATGSQDRVEPAPMVKEDAALLFDGIKWPTETWRKEMASPPRWLLQARVSPGERGRSGAPSTWNPVELASVLMERGEATEEKITQAFTRGKQFLDSAAAWLPKWTEHLVLRQWGQ